MGNMNPLRADLLRAFIYSRTNEEMNYDAAILIGEQLMRNDSVLASTDLQEEVLEVLLNACRLRKDNEAAFYWATELSDFYRGKAYAYLADANASLLPPNKELARHYIVLYEQTIAGQSLTGRHMIAHTLGKVGAYDKMLDIYDEVEQQLGADTLNDN